MQAEVVDDGAAFGWGVTASPARDEWVGLVDSPRLLERAAADREAAFSLQVNPSVSDERVRRWSRPVRTSILLAAAVGAWAVLTVAGASAVVGSAWLLGGLIR